MMGSKYRDSKIKSLKRSATAFGSQYLTKPVLGLIAIFWMVTLSFFVWTNSKYNEGSFENARKKIYDYPDLDWIRENVLIPPPPVQERRTSSDIDKSYSEHGQDEFLNTNVFHGLRDGFFVENRAHNGIWMTNTLYFEETFGWTGLLVEYDPAQFEYLRSQKRNAWLLKGCLSTHRSDRQMAIRVTGYGDFWDGLLTYLTGIQIDGSQEDKITVDCYPLNLLLEAIGVKRVDYLSLDDFEANMSGILQSIDYDKYKFGVIGNKCSHCHDGKGGWSNRTESNNEDIDKQIMIRELMKTQGYDEKFYVHQDMYYVSRDLL